MGRLSGGSVALLKFWRDARVKGSRHRRLSLAVAIRDRMNISSPVPFIQFNEAVPISGLPLLLLSRRDCSAP